MADELIAMQFRVNGEDRASLAGGSETLLKVLRDRLGLTGAKRGCDQGVCGACTVLADDKPIRACLAIAANTTDVEITTIEGLAGDGPLTPVQQAFVAGGALQCGFCTPGMIITLSALLETNPRPSADQTRHAISGNLCRCTGYTKIVEAVSALTSGEAA